MRKICISLSVLLLTFVPFSTAPAEELVALVDIVGAGQGLLTVDSNNPEAAAGPTPIVGIVDQFVLAIDYRPLTNELYALTRNSVYTVDRTTGQATQVGAGFVTGPAFQGETFGFDFNPQIDRIRVVNEADDNQVAHPDTGDANVAATTPVAYDAGDANEGTDPNVAHHAYTNPILGQLTPEPPGTQLYAIDYDLDILTTQANNAGTLNTVGSLGIDATSAGGFDIATTGNAFAAFGDFNFNGEVGSTEEGTNGVEESFLYSVDLSSGAATLLGEIGDNVFVRGLAAVPIPEPASVTLLTMLSLVAVLRRRF